MTKIRSDKKVEDRIEDKLIELIDRLVDEKISVNPEFLRFTFYEVRVKNSVTSEEEKDIVTMDKYAWC